jgi:hypothetical protein
VNATGPIWRYILICRQIGIGQMYPGRRFALPWAISFCPFGAAGSMVDRYLPGPSTLAEGVPALRAFAPQVATYRGLRPRQRVCRPFGPMACGVNSGAVKVTVTPRCGSLPLGLWPYAINLRRTIRRNPRAQCPHIGLTLR